MWAPRARAASSGSSTSIPAPSPKIIPRRSTQNGRQVSGATRRIASACDGDVRAAAAQQLQSHADGVIGRRAGGGKSERRAGEPELHGDVAGACVGHGARNGERMHFVAATQVNI